MGNLPVDTWSSGAVTNSNGHTFTLYLMPARPFNSIWTSYGDICTSAGLHSVTYGHDYNNQPLHGEACAAEACITLPAAVGPPWDPEAPGGYTAAAGWVNEVTGWEHFVLYRGTHQRVYPTSWYEGGPHDLGAGVPLPLCGGANGVESECLFYPLCGREE
jgi:hypothetical protein